MDYMFLIYNDTERFVPPTPAEREAMIQAHWAVMDDATQRGVFKGASPLKPVDSARTFRASDKGVLVTDGPHAETKEVLAGFYMISCENDDEAAVWAKRLAEIGRSAVIEVRPLAPIPARVEQRAPASV